MISKISISNFKAFADEQQIPIRPITLIYGANSSGKSSIIHSLILARQAMEKMEKGDLDIHRTDIGGESVDLGGFRQYIHHRDAGRRLEWGAELDTAKFKGRMAELWAAAKKINLTITVGIELDNEGKPVVGALPVVQAYQVKANGKDLFRMSRRREGHMQMDRLDHEHPVFRNFIQNIIEASTTSQAISPKDYEDMAEIISGIVPELVSESCPFLPLGLMRRKSTTDSGQTLLFSQDENIPIIPVSKGKRKEDLASAITLYFPRMLSEIITGLTDTVKNELMRLQYLGPLRSYPPRHLAFSQQYDLNWYAGGGYAWDMVRKNAKIRNIVNIWLGAKDRLQTPYELIVRDLVDVDQLDQTLIDSLESIDQENSQAVYEEGFRATTTPSPTIKDVEKEAAKIKEAIRSSNTEKMTELLLFDMRSKTIVSHRDVGIGVSQVLPVLVMAHGSQNKIITIEQPEIHLHPALQADLGDVFLQSALGANKNRFVIETHSEHLLLRIMRRIRETNAKKLPAGGVPVRPEDIMVLFVEPDGTRSVIREMPLNEKGEIVKAWPGGFFEEGFAEMF
jgi:hypothetical protein